MDLNFDFGPVPEKIKVSVTGFLIIALLFGTIIPALPIPFDNVVFTVGIIILIISVYLFFSGVHDRFIKGIKDIELLFSVEEAKQHTFGAEEESEESDFFFTFIVNNRSETPTSIFKIEYNLPIESPNFVNPVLNLFDKPVHIKARSSRKIEDYFRYTRLPDNANAEITFYHTHGEVSIETTISEQPIRHLAFNRI